MNKADFGFFVVRTFKDEQSRRKMSCDEEEQASRFTEERYERRDRRHGCRRFGRK